MTVQTGRRFTASRLSTARALRAALPVALLVALAGDRAIGQGSTPTISIGDVTIMEGNSGITTASFAVTLANANAMASRVSFSTADAIAVGGVLPRPVRTSGPFAIPDGTGTPVKITFNVSGVAQPLAGLSLLIEQLAHPEPRDLDFLLVSPDGRTMVVQSDAIGIPLNGTSYGLKDGQPPLPANGVPGFNSPTNYGAGDVFGAPAPPGPHPEAAPAGTATLNDIYRGRVPNGVWDLFVHDDTPGNHGTIGAVTLLFEVQEPGTDYAPTSGELRWVPGGPTTQTVTVPIYGDTTVEPNETFWIDLSGAFNATIGVGRGTGTITNDDGGSGGLPPTAVNDRYAKALLKFINVKALTVPASSGVLANDSSNGGGPLTAELVSGPASGTLTLNPDGSFVFRDSGFSASGGLFTFSYRARNEYGASNVAEVLIEFVVPPGPTAVDDQYEHPNAMDGGFFGAGQGVLLRNDDDNGGGPMSAELVSAPASGRFDFDSTGRFVYYPPDGFAGTATFTYRLKTEFGVSNTATVSIAITRGTRPPAPMNLRVDSIVGHRPVVRFDAPLVSPAATGYEIAGGTQPGETTAVVPTGGLYGIFPFPFDAPFGSFVLRALSVLGNERSSPSNEVALHMNTTVTPSAPANLLGSMDGTRLTLAWDDTFGGGIPTVTLLRVSGALSLTVPLGPGETFSYPTVPAGDYTFEVLNGNAGGLSAASNQVTLSSPGTCSPPQMPEDFLLYVNGLVVGAIWDLPANGPAPNGYLLHVTSPVFTGSVPLNRRHIEAQVPPGTYTASVETTTACGGARTPEQTVVVQ